MPAPRPEPWPPQFGRRCVAGVRCYTFADRGLWVKMNVVPQPGRRKPQVCVRNSVVQMDRPLFRDAAARLLRYWYRVSNGHGNVI